MLRQYQQRFRYILVDEYQDTNVAQYLWLRLLGQSGAAREFADAPRTPLPSPRAPHPLSPVGEGGLPERSDGEPGEGSSLAP